MSMSHMSLSIYGQSLEGGAYRISGACLKEQHSMGIAHISTGVLFGRTLNRIVMVIQKRLTLTMRTTVIFGAHRGAGTLSN